jgi:signal transduction histidine kinase/CheY-like chemotaxis protein
MLRNIPFHRYFKPSEGIPLSRLLVVPFVLQITGLVGLVGYFSVQASQQTFENLAAQVMSRTSSLVEHHLETRFGIPEQVSQINDSILQTRPFTAQESAQFERVLWKQVHTFGVDRISYQDQKGALVSIGFDRNQKPTLDVLNALTRQQLQTYTLTAQGQRQNLLTPSSSLSQAQLMPFPWYQQAAQQGRSSWMQTDHCGSSRESTLALCYSHPVYDHLNQLKGVLAIELKLSQLNEALRHVVLEHGNAASSIFILKRDGSLLASSTVTGTATTGTATTSTVHDRPVLATQSADPLIRKTVHQLQSVLGNTQPSAASHQFDFPWNGDRQYAQVTPWTNKLGLDWSIVVVIPQKGFTGVTTSNPMTPALWVTALLGTTLLSIFTAQWIARPIRRLSEASRAIANGETDHGIEVKGIRELEILSQSFNQMVDQLQESLTQLEIRVEQRTAELNEAKQTAEAASRAKSAFLANMSHELRTPLNAILGLSQLMHYDGPLTPDQEENLEIINRSGEHLLSLINDVLDMSKIEAGRVTLNERDFDLYELLKTIEDMFRLKAADRGIQLSVHYLCDLPPYIRGDEGKLRQVLINLLGNAVKFTQSGWIMLSVGLANRVGGISGEPDYTLSPTPYTLNFAVEDTGPGIAPDELGQLFESFVQTSTGCESQQGTGLGLAISRKYVQLMGGEDLKVWSVVGEGTRFTFDIQVGLSEPFTPQSQRSQRVVGLQEGQPSYRILVVDDYQTNRQLLTKLLSPLGFEVREADNGKAAIVQWECWQPHLIWMDMQMPEMRGCEATRYIKSQPNGNRTVIIALTASVFEEERITVLAAGCDDFVRKPVADTLIFEKMAQHLGVQYCYAENLPISVFKGTEGKLVAVNSVDSR